MNECKDIQVLLALQLNDRSGAEQARVEAHLSACPGCAAIAEAYAEQDRLIRDAPRVGLAPSQRGQLLSTIQRERRRHEMRTKLFAVLSAVAAIAILIALAFGLKMMLPPGERFVPSAPSGTDPVQPVQGSYPTNAEEVLWTYVGAAWDEDLAHRTTTVLQRQPWDDGEVILVTYEDTFPESAGGRRQRVLTWVLVEPDPGEAGWTVVAAGNKERVHWPVDRTMPTPEDVPVYTFWLSERRGGEGHPLSVIYGLWDARLGDAPKAMRLTLGDRSTEIPLENDSFLYVAEESLTEKRPKISYDCDPPGGGRCGVAVYTDQPFSTPEPLVFAGEIRKERPTYDPLTGQSIPFTLGTSDSTDPSAPGTLPVRSHVHFGVAWELVAPPSADWQVFVHLENKAGELMLQDDVAVDWPAQPCAEGEYDPTCTVSSKHVWTIPADFPPGLYTIKVGLYDPETGERAPVTSPGGDVGKTTVALGQVRIVSEDEATLGQDLEKGLATLLVNDPTAECGWEILGEADRETYLWAICQSPSGTAVSAPAVVYWTKSETGTRRIREVQMPRDGSFYGEDVRELFPPEVQERIFDHEIDTEAIWEQIERDLVTVTGTVVDNAASAQVITLQDANGEQWHVPWMGAAIIRRPDGSLAQFRDIDRGMTVEVVGFPRTEAASSNMLSAVRMDILLEEDSED